MKRALLGIVLLLAGCGGAAAPASAPAARGDSGKGAAGYTFVASHDDIVTKAKAEGELKVLSTADPASIKLFRESFPKKYPFLKFDIRELTGTEADQRFMLELKAGQAKEWDILSMSEENYAEMLPYVEKLDVLGMAEQGVLAIPPKMVDPRERDAVAPGSTLGVVAYNKNLVPPDKVPKVWEDLLKPEWKGRKIVAEVRPLALGALVPAKGEEWVKDFATKLKDQQPVWARGQTNVLTALAAGEYALHSGINFHSTQRAIDKGAQSLAVAAVEPVSVRLSLASAVQKGARHPNAGLLFLEYMASPEAQKILDDVEPYKASIYGGEGTTRAAGIVAGKQTSVFAWEHQAKMGEYEKMINQAFGLPKAEVS